MKQTNIQTDLQEIKTLLQQQAEKPLSIWEACKYLSISKNYLYKLTCRNEIPYFKPNGKLIYFKQSDLDKYIFRNRLKTQAKLEQKEENFVATKWYLIATLIRFFIEMLKDLPFLKHLFSLTII